MNNTSNLFAFLSDSAEDTRMVWVEIFPLSTAVCLWKARRYRLPE